MRSSKLKTTSDGAQGSTGLIFLSLHHRCFHWWEEIRDVGLSNPTKEIEYLELAREISSSLRTATEELLRARQVPVNLKVEEVCSDDARRFIVLYKYYCDIWRLSNIELAALREQGELAERIKKVDLFLANADTLRTIKGPNFREALYSVHGVLGYLGESQFDFLGDLDRIIGDFEQNALETWHGRFCPEKALLAMVLRAWRGRLYQMEQGEKQPDFSVVPMSRKVFVDGDLAKIDLAIGTDDGTRLMSESSLAVRSQEDIVEYPEGKLRILAPGVARVAVLVGKPSEGWMQEKSASFSVNLGGKEGSCEVVLERGRAPEDCIRRDPFEHWICHIKGQIHEASKYAVVLCVEGTPMETLDLRAQEIQRLLTEEGHEVEKLDFDGFHFNTPGSREAVGLVEAKNFQHAGALSSYLGLKEAVKVFELHLGGYLRYRYGDIALDGDALELLDEYLRPIQAPEIVKRFLTNLDVSLQSEPEWRLTADAVDGARNLTPVAEAVKERIGKVGQEAQTVLYALKEAVEKASSRVSEKGNPSVNIGMIARSMALDGSSLEGTLRALEEKHGLVERDGRLQYRFANKVYFEAAKECMGEHNHEQ